MERDPSSEKLNCGDEDDFKIYQARHRPRRLAPNEVSLTKTNIVISEELSEALGPHERVVLLYNGKADEIGIRPVSSPEERGYKVSYRSISSRSFYQHFKITARGRFKAQVNRLGMLVIFLNKQRR